MNVPIVFCADAHYGQYLPVALQSIIENSARTHNYQILIFDCGIKADDLAAVERQITLHDNFTLEIKNIAAHLAEHEQAFTVEKAGRLSAATYGRLLIPDLCAAYEKVIYADIDMIFNRDLAELLQTDLGDASIGAVIDVNIEQERYSRPGIKAYAENVLGLSAEQFYVNAGLLLLNIKAWNDQKLGARCIALLSQRPLKRHDQDAVNMVAKGHIAYLPQYWNCVYPLSRNWQINAGNSAATEANSKNAAETISEDKACSAALAQAEQQKQQALQNCSAAVFHFVGALKPWHDMNDDKALIWWRYARNTEYYDKLAARALSNSAGLNLQKGAMRYRFLGLPLWKVQYAPEKKKYFFCGLCIGREIVNIRKHKKTLYLFGLPLLQREKE